MVDIKKYELKRCPKPPKKIRSKGFKGFFGIVSPSLLFSYVAFGDKDVRMYLIRVKQYQLYRRTLTKSGYKELVRYIRNQEGKYNANYKNKY